MSSPREQCCTKKSSNTSLHGMTVINKKEIVPFLAEDNVQSVKSDRHLDTSKHSENSVECWKERESDEEAMQCEETPKNVEAPGCCARYPNQQMEPLESWLILIRNFFFNMLTGMNFTLFSLLYVEYSNHFQLPKATLGWVDSLMHGTLCMMGLFVSWPVDLCGCNWMAMTGAVLCSLGLALASFAHNMFVLYLTQGIIVGAGTAFVSLSSSVVIQKHFSHNRALATAMSLLGFSSGCFVGPYLINHLLEHYGWRGTLLLFSAIIAHRAPLGLTFWLPQGRAPPSSKASQPEIAKHMFITMTKKAMDFSLLKNLGFLLFIFASMLQKIFRIGTVAHFPSFTISLGYNMANAAFLTSIVAASNTSFRFVTAFVANLKEVSPFGVYILGHFIGVVSIVMLLCLPGYACLVSYVICMGLHLALTNTVGTLILVELLGVDLISRSLALLNFLNGTVLPFATPFTGWLYDISGMYELPYLVMGCVSVAGTITALASLLVHRRQVKVNKDDIILQRENKEFLTLDCAKKH